MYVSSFLNQFELIYLPTRIIDISIVKWFQPLQSNTINSFNINYLFADSEVVTSIAIQYYFSCSTQFIHLRTV